LLLQEQKKVAIHQIESVWLTKVSEQYILTNSCLKSLHELAVLFFDTAKFTLYGFKNIPSGLRKIADQKIIQHFSEMMINSTLFALNYNLLSVISYLFID